jgi:hypothetical protein
MSEQSKPGAPGRGYETGGYGGNPQTESLERIRRVETRLTNLIRTLGLHPGRSTPDPMKPRVLHADGVLYVSSQMVTMAEIGLAAAVAASADSDTTFKIVLCNQPWGEITVPGSPIASHKDSKR